jgi:MFS family permease
MSVDRETGIVRLLFLLQFITMGAMEMSGPFWPVRIRELAGSASEAEIGGILTYVAPMLGTAVAGAFWGRIGDRIGHRAMMLRALAGLALTQLALAFADTVPLIVALRFIQGACAGFSAPAQAYGVALVARERRGRLFAFLQISTNLGSLGGAVLGGWLLDRSGFAAINVAAAVICVGVFAGVILLLPPRSPQPRETKSARAAPADASPVAVGVIPALLAVLAMLLAARLLPQTSFSPYVAATFAVPHWLVGLAYGLLATGFIVSATGWARFFEERGIGESLRLIALVALGCATLTGVAAVTSEFAIFAALQFLWGAALGATTPVLTALISRSTPANRQGRVLGLVQATSQIASIGGISLGGAVTGIGGTGILYPSVACLYLVAAVLILFIERLIARRSSPILPTSSCL